MVDWHEFEALDVMLKSGELLNVWLRQWINRSAEDPASVRAVLREQGDDYRIIELQCSETGKASGGIVYCSQNRCVIIPPALEADGRTTVRTKEDMDAALRIAMRRDKAAEWGREVYVFRWVIGFLMLGVLFLLAWALGT